MSDVSRPDTGTPGWVVGAAVIVGLFGALWVFGVVMSAIGLIVKAIVSVAIIALAAWFIVNALTGSKRR